MLSRCFLLILLFITFGHAFAESAPRYYIEGIVADRDRPGESLAVINGTTYREGDKVDDYELIEIFSNGARLVHRKTKEEKVLLIGRDTPPGWLVAENYASEYEKLIARTPRETAGAIANPFEAIQRAKEAGAMARMTQLRMALEQYRSETDRYPENLEQLVENGIIEKDLYTGWEDYEFFYEVAGKGSKFSLYAEPMKPAKSTRFFYLDETGILRAEKGVQAGKDSPILE